MRMGSIDLTEADLVEELLSATDPLNRTAFQSCYSAALSLTARYDDGLSVATDFAECASRYRLDFAAPYAAIAAALAHAGRRRFGRAVSLVREAVRLAAGRNQYVQHLAFALETRVLTAYGKHDEAIARPLPDLRSALPAMRGEVLGSHALALAAGGRIGEAEKLIDDVEGTSRAVEVSVLCPAIRAMTSLRRGDTGLTERVHDLEEQAFRTGAVDLLVVTYRCLPELLSVLMRVTTAPDRLVDLMRRVGDEDLARVAGHPIDVSGDPVQRLSRREREVYDLMCQGLSNAQIAQVLFISEATVKVHMQHIFDKCGVRSRTALAVQAALRRSGQATAT